ncbi:MAG: hypothetical protein CL908_18545 [Deltaproteobacteria bacterium]|nr:hypothetical protein [Deltaproteobacteria bacterium]
MDDAVAQNKSLVWYGHAIDFHGSTYYVGESRLRDMILRAQSRGLVFRRMRDLCSWVTLGGADPPLNVHASARPLSDVRFGDFDGDRITDAFRANGRTWKVLLGQGNGFYDSAGTEHWQHLNTSGHELDTDEPSPASLEAAVTSIASSTGSTGVITSRIDFKIPPRASLVIPPLGAPPSTTASSQRLGSSRY